jgi:3',5'-cyclic AMP phosphodiesterase CpdA
MRRLGSIAELRRAAVAATVALAALSTACAGVDAPRAAATGPGSTLRATLVDRDGDGFLERGPAERLLDRRELGTGGARADRVIARFGQITDAHVRDEESPARVPFLDRLGPPFDPAFRPQEAESAQVLDAAVRALNGQRPQAVVMTGDIVDSAQANELDQALAVLSGGRVDPDTGAPGYAGVQAAANPDPYYYRPQHDAPRHPGLLGAAQRPFTAAGLRAPWYPVVGNHDLLVQGEVPATPAIEALATGGEMVTELDPGLRPPTDEASAPAVVDALLSGPEGLPGRTQRVPPDSRRRPLSSAQAVEFLRAAAAPRAGTVGGRLDYGFDLGERVRGLVLDTVNRAGTSRGLVLPAQVAWLRRELAAAGDRHVVVFSHNPLDASDGGEPALAAMAASGNVVAAVAGHRHRNRIVPQLGGGFWLIGTSSLADFPQQARMFKLLEAADGGVVLETWMVDHDGRGVAGPARELAHLDAQGGRPLGYAGRPQDRNARLYVPPLRRGATS